jgi:UDP-glucose 4-epimerase
LERLSARGHEVRALVRRPAPWLTVDQVAVDLASDDGRLAKALDGVTAVVHLAGANEVTAAAAPDRALTETVVAARHTAAAAIAAGVRRLVYLSTVHVYGAAITDGAVLTEDTVPEPRAGYAVARLASEHLSTAAMPDTVVLRLTNSVGAPAHPGVARWTLVANDLCRQAVTTGEVRLRTHGMQWRDFVPMDDVLDAVTLATDATGLPSGTYNLGAGASTTVRALAVLVQDVVAEATGRRPPLVAPEPPACTPTAYTVSIARLSAKGWRPGGSLEDAVKETVMFCLEHKEEL